ncbi:hypothetical protein CI610_00258 [invertebrate metagenome]|uniref:Uncharacterized protein n=1 Tax=invertebrate metagenome TaxID=1711999 RepID=A0A2H9TBZ7_9ZZZZ
MKFFHGFYIAFMISLLRIIIVSFISFCYAGNFGKDENDMFEVSCKLFAFFWGYECLDDKRPHVAACKLCCCSSSAETDVVNGFYDSYKLKIFLPGGEVCQELVYYLSSDDQAFMNLAFPSAVIRNCRQALNGVNVKSFYSHRYIGWFKSREDKYDSLKKHFQKFSCMICQSSKEALVPYSRVLSGLKDDVEKWMDKHKEVLEKSIKAEYINECVIPLLNQVLVSSRVDDCVETLRNVNEKLLLLKMLDVSGFNILDSVSYYDLAFVTESSGWELYINEMEYEIDNLDRLFKKMSKSYREWSNFKEENCYKDFYEMTKEYRSVGDDAEEYRLAMDDSMSEIKDMLGCLIERIVLSLEKSRSLLEYVRERYLYLPNGIILYIKKDGFFNIKKITNIIKCVRHLNERVLELSRDFYN